MRCSRFKVEILCQIPGFRLRLLEIAPGNRFDRVPGKDVENSLLSFIFGLGHSNELFALDSLHGRTLERRNIKYINDVAYLEIIRLFVIFHLCIDTMAR